MLDQIFTRRYVLKLEKNLLSFSHVKLFLVLSLLGLQLNCGGGGGTLSILPSSEEFTQSDELNPKMDILWVVDSSGSMSQEIQNVKDNINEFVSLYKDLDYNFRMGVISTGAWALESYEEYKNYQDFVTCETNDGVGNCGLAPNQPESNEDRSYLIHPSDGISAFGRLHTGECVNQSTGVPFITKNTSNLGNVFAANFDVYGKEIGQLNCGTNGTNYSAGNTKHIPFIHDFYSNKVGSAYPESARTRLFNYVADERPLQSMRGFLRHSVDNSFIRSDAFLAVILITDEADHSRNSLRANNGQAGQHDVQTEYIDELDVLKGKDFYKIYTITQTSGRPRLKAASDLTEGLSLEITRGDDGDISPSDPNKTKGAVRYLDMLLQITTNVVEAASVFPINCDPIPNTISVETYPPPYNQKVIVPKASSNNGEGWTFIPTNQSGEEGGSLIFSESYFPKSGTKFYINYTPDRLECNPRG